MKKTVLINHFSLLAILFFLNSCAAALPDMFKTIDDIATDDAITIKVDRDAFKKDTDVHILLDVVNKDAPKAAS